MEYSFQLQDPTDPGTIYLFESILAALGRARAWRAIFAFASRQAVDALFIDPVVAGFLARGGEFDLIVGIDAVTNRATLERLQELEAQHPDLTVRVFWNRTRGIFHPKISHFTFRGGRQALIVGSGNLTPGGLRENFEGYSILYTTHGEVLDLVSWEEFLRRHAGDIRPIDAEALERAARNIIRGRQRRDRVAADIEPDVGKAEEEAEGEAEGAGPDVRVLVAEVPAAGGRWHQVHFNEAVIDEFFRVRPNSPQRVFLRERRPDGSLGAEEAPRPCVMSERNLNRKIELAAKAGQEYPADRRTRPIAVFREIGVRNFEYMLLMPRDDGYNEMLNFIGLRPALGRGLHRVLTNLPEVRAAWPRCPL